MNTENPNDFLTLNDEMVAKIAGPSERFLALIEGAFKVLVQMPGGGFSIEGQPRASFRTREVLMGIKALIDNGAEPTEADVRRLIDAPLPRPLVDERAILPATAIVMGRRGAVMPKTDGQAEYVKILTGRDLAFGLGPAGSGKTFLAVAYGLSLLLKSAVERLVITRPAIEAGERLGFLPGDLNEKVDPYLTPIWQALGDILGTEALRRRREKGEIEVAPLAYMRGRTLSNAYIIVDEAQNTTKLQMKMLLTRLGEGSKMAVTGDPTQVDLPNRRDSGLIHAVSLLADLKGVGVARLTQKDIVRHELVARIVQAYDTETQNP
jgi:phosphate starvation-inducible PhoH-like protein